ncbi:SMC family ATPase [Candidatus Woesearchaeota archaeon]|nr:SMC family ATPase [Candidatus Woesearchaeota archaeon]
MILKNITLENIRSYTNQTIAFPQGTVLLSGDIGSGKSSILLGIEFALFGVRRDLSATGLLRNGEKRGFVELNFCVDDKDVAIRRTLKRGSDGIAQEAGYIIVNGRRTDATAVELKAAVLDLLHYPKEALTKSKSLIWRYTVYTPQEEMKQILFEARDARVDTLRQIFSIDKYKRAAENAQIYTKRLRDDSKVLELRLLDEDAKRKELAERHDSRYRLTEEQRTLMPRMTELMQRIDHKKREIRASEENLKLLANIRMQHNGYCVQITEKKALQERMRNDAATLAVQIEAATIRLETMLPLVADPNAINALEGEILRKEEELRLVQNRKSQAEGKLMLVGQRVSELSAEVAQKNHRLATRPEKENTKQALLAQVKDKRALQDEICALEQRIFEMNNQLKECQVHHKHAHESKSAVLNLQVCPTCKQTVAEDHKRAIAAMEDGRIEELTKAIHELAEEQAALAESLTRQKNLLQSITAAEQTLAGLMVELQQFDVIAAEVEKLEKLLLEVSVEKQTAFDILQLLEQRNLEAERTEIAAKRTMLKKLQEQRLAIMEREQLSRSLDEKKLSKTKLEELTNDLQTEVAGLEMLRANCTAQLEAHKHLEERVPTLREDLDGLQNEEKSLNIKLAELRERLEAQNQFIAQLETDLAKKEQARKQLENIKQLHNWFDGFFINLMGTMEQHVMLKIHEQFNELFTTWFATLIEDETLSIRLDQEFSPIVLQNGYEIDVENLSGGEKTAVALAYRLALNKVINDVVSEIKTKDLMILDEPTDGFSSEQLDKLKDVLDSLGIKQVIMVSHVQ